jgi:hypothetical protein
VKNNNGEIINNQRRHQYWQCGGVSMKMSIIVNKRNINNGEYGGANEIKIGNM